MNTKTPTLREKVRQYEDFLHKINMFCTCGNSDGIRELIENADSFSYSHRVGNGELSERDQQKAINSTFWRLCDTPRADKALEERWAKREECVQSTINDPTEVVLSKWAPCTVGQATK